MEGDVFGVWRIGIYIYISKVGVYRDCVKYEKRV